MLRELYLAKEFLTKQKGQYRDPEAPNYLYHSLSGYCGEIGLPYQTANNWLRHFQYIPREISGTGQDTLMLFKATVKEDATVKRALMESRIAEVLRTGERPTDWTDEEDAELKRRLANARLAEQVEKYNAPVSAAAKADYFTETMSRSKDVINFRLEDRSQMQAQLKIFRHIENYLDAFDNPETKALAAFNIALKAKNLANEIAEQHLRPVQAAKAKRGAE